jgi:hypothetical protein
MTQEKVLEYLKVYGEKINSEIEIEGLNDKKTAGILSKLFSLNKVTRRMVPHKGKSVWSYRAIGTGPLEPEHIYILRNLPRHENSATDSY